MDMNAAQSVHFGKYVLLEKIATGGMAELFRAKLTGAEGFEKLIVIKRILHHLNGEEKLIESFIEEAKLAAYLHHPNIVQIYDFGFMDETYFIAMECLFGKDLRFTFKRILEKKTGIDYRIALFIASQVLAGLDYAHTLNDFDGNHLQIIHRDIGPQNIFVTYDGQIKIIDFGIAKAANQDTNTQFGTIKGKVSYMSPEQANGEVIDHRSDIFSVGIVLYELLTLTRMYDGDTFQVLAKARNASFTPAEALRDDLPEQIYRIMNKALRKEPERRYQSAESMMKDIDLFMAETGTRISQKDMASFMRSLFDDECDDCKTRTLLNAERYLIQEPSESTVLTIHENRPGHRQARVLWRRFRVFCYVVLLVVPTVFGLQKLGADVQIRALIQNHRTMNQDQKLAEKGVELKESRQYDQAVAAFEDALRKTPDLMETYRQDYSDALTSLGETQMVSDLEASRLTLEKSWKVNPDNSRTCFLLGKIHTVLKDNEKALGYYQMAVRLDSDNPDIYFNMGYSHASMGNYDKAKEMYKRVIERSPSFVDQAYFNLGLIEYQTGRKQDAMRFMKKAVEANPLNTNAIRFLESKK